MFWYQIYSANNWQIYSVIGYILPTIGGYMSIRGCRVAMQNMLFFKDTHSSKCTICNPAPKGRTNTP